MTKSTTGHKIDSRTSEKIKQAARRVFHTKGYAATRTRNIAEEAGINLALLNYYFKSKEKLFELIVFETMSAFMQNMEKVFNDENTSLEKKVELMAEKYIDLLIAEPEIPLFILSEMKNNPNNFFRKLSLGQMIMNSDFIRQYLEAASVGKVNEPNPLHFVMNLMGLIVFPFASSPLLKKIGNIKDPEFNKLMQERKKKIPLWINAMMKA